MDDFSHEMIEAWRKMFELTRPIVANTMKSISENIHELDEKDLSDINSLIRLCMWPGELALERAKTLPKDSSNKVGVQELEKSIMRQAAELENISKKIQEIYYMNELKRTGITFHLEKRG